MGQASKFKDGKVLRSENTKLTLLELRMLYQVMEEGANTVDDVQRLTDIGHKIEPALGEYYERIYAAQLASRTQVREGASAEHATLAMNIIMDKLDSQYGNDPADDILLTNNEWEWMADRWRNNKQFSGSREAREHILRITDVVRNALGVKYVNKQAWVENDPEPTSAGDSSSNGHTSGSDGTDSKEIESAIEIRPLSMRPA